MDFTYSIRSATPKDAENVIAMIAELADYEKMLDQCKLTADEFRNDGFGEQPAFRCLIVEATHSNSDDKKTVGYALFYYMYSSFDGKSVYLEDLYVKEPYRKHKIGGDLMKTVAKIAIENRCSQYNFACLGWNSPALNFYKASGAKDMTELEDWHMIRFDQEEMQALCQKSSNLKAT